MTRNELKKKRWFAALRAPQHVCSTKVKNIPLCALNQSKHRCRVSWKISLCTLNHTKQCWKNKLLAIFSSFLPAIIKILSLPSKALIFAHFQFSFKTKENHSRVLSHLVLSSFVLSCNWLKALRDNAQWMFSAHQTTLILFCLSQVIVSHLSRPL